MAAPSRLDSRLGTSAKKILHAMALQGRLEAQAEEAKALLPVECTLEACFSALDRGQKGYVADADLWLLLQDFGGTASFASLCALVRESQLRRPYDQWSLAGRLSLRDLAGLVLPVDSEEFEAVSASSTDEEARSALYLLRHSEACPNCGIRIQRDGDAAGCPNVTCPLCGTVFRCFCVVGDRDKRWFHQGGGIELVLMPNGKYQLHRLICVAAQIAEELDRGRRALLTQPGGCDLGTLGEAFNALAGGRPGFSLQDLHSAMLQLGPHLSEIEMQLLWQRYSLSWPPSSTPALLATFSEFTRQLRPHGAGVS